MLLRLGRCRLGWAGEGPAEETETGAALDHPGLFGVQLEPEVAKTVGHEAQGLFGGPLLRREEDEVVGVTDEGEVLTCQGPVELRADRGCIGWARG